MKPAYNTIHNSPIIMEHPFPKPGEGLRSGSVILVDRGDQYVVAKRYNHEETGEPDREWGQGFYFPHNRMVGIVRTSQAEALMEAAAFFKQEVDKL